MQGICSGSNEASTVRLMWLPGDVFVSHNCTFYSVCYFRFKNNKKDVVTKFLKRTHPTHTCKQQSAEGCFAGFLKLNQGPFYCRADKGGRDKAETPEKEAGDGSWWLRHSFFASWGHRPVLSAFMSSRVLCVLAFSQIKPRSPALSLQIVDKQNVLWPYSPAPATSKPRFPTPKATLDYDSSLTVTGESSVALWVCSLIG